LTRVKKAVDYINALCLNKNAEKRSLGKKLEVQYTKWMKTLDLKCIQLEEIGFTPLDDVKRGCIRGRLYICRFPFPYLSHAAIIFA